MSSEMPTKQAVIDMTIYITRTIPDVTQQDYKEIIRILLKSGISDHKIQTKGGGTQVKYKDIPPMTIVAIHDYLKKKMASKMDMLATLTEEPTAESD